MTLARIFRGTAFRRTIVVSAKKSEQFSKLPLQFRWTLLQGDPARVKIEPSKNGVDARITVAWHPEIRPPAGPASHRVDIGVFASNGLNWSAPSFITFYMIPSEARFYTKEGRLDEVCYEAGNPDAGLPASDDPRWLWLGRRLAADDGAPGVKLLTQTLAPSAIKK